MSQSFRLTTMWFRSLLALCVIAFVVAQDLTTTTAKPHHTHKPHHGNGNTTREPSVHESFRYVYEPYSHDMLLINGKSCYIFTLTEDERVAVHTDSGISTLELKLLGLLSTGTITSKTVDTLGKHVSHACGGHHVTNYYTVV